MYYCVQTLKEKQMSIQQRQQLAQNYNELHQKYQKTQGHFNTKAAWKDWVHGVLPEIVALAERTLFLGCNAWPLWAPEKFSGTHQVLFKTKRKG